MKAESSMISSRLPGTELLQSPFRTQLSMGSLSQHDRRSLRSFCQSLQHCHQSLRQIAIADAGIGDTASAGRFGKSTHISMISNSVTHLRSYTNSAIADITGNSAPISPVTPRNRRRLRVERRRLRIERRYRRIEWRLFHDVSQCFKCFMMFY